MIIYVYYVTCEFAINFSSRLYKSWLRHCIK